MADIELVIKIPEEDYNRIKNIPDAFDSRISRVYKAIKNGTALPKGHGRLADLDTALKCVEETADCDEKFYAMCLFDWAMSKRVVLEADKGGE